MNGSTASTLTLRPARVLLGWMDTEEALRVQYRDVIDAEFSAEAKERLRIARQRVATRPPGVDQRDLVTPAPPQLAPYIDGLRRHPLTEKVLAEGWTPSLVDLRRVCAFQSRVFTAHAEERVAAADAGDLESIAAVSLPVPGTLTAPAAFDQERKAWILTSPDPNLRVVGNFRQQFGSQVGFGFALARGSSFLMVVHHGGRHYLLDGYHRAVSFLRRGITHVPAMTRTLSDGEPFHVPPGMLSPSVYLGDRPPQLSDFLEEEVSLAVELPVFRKIIIVQAVEIMA